MSTQPTWVRNQIDGNTAGGTLSTFVANFGVAWTSGRALAVLLYTAFDTDAFVTPSSITDDVGNSYTVFSGLVDPNASTNGYVFAAGVNLLGSITQLNINYSVSHAATGGMFVFAEEIDGARFIDGHNSTLTSGPTTSFPSGNFTTTDFDLIWTGFFPNTTNVTKPTNYTAETVDNIAFAYSAILTATTSGTTSNTWTTGVNASGWNASLGFAGPRTTGIFASESTFPQRRKFRPLRQFAEEQWPFTATPNPLKMQGIYYDPQFPQRQRQDPRQARGDEQWPFTAVPTPAQVGWEWRPEFARRRFIPSRAADEQWPFTAVPTPGQFGWDNPEKFAQRVRFRPSQSADEQWPFTATPTPGPLGWQVQDPFPLRRRPQLLVPAVDVVSPQAATQTPTSLEWAWNPQFPQRVRFRTFQSSDEQWAFTAVVTPAQFGWDNPEHFPVRIKFRTFQQADEQWPFTEVGTPGPFGWQLDPQFAVRRRFRTFQSADEQWVFTSVPTPTAFGFAWDPQFPFRVRYRPLTLSDEQWSFTATPTPTQFGWHIEPQVPVRSRPRPQLAQFDVTTFVPGTPTPTNIDFAYPPEFLPVITRFRPLIYEPFNPQPPPSSPTFQTMTAMATKIKNAFGGTAITVTLRGTGAFVFTAAAGPTILSEALPFGSAHVVLTSGSTPVSVALAASNDGVNFVQVGPAATNFPTIINLTALPLLSTVPYAYHAWVVTGGDATTLVTITEIFTGWRG